MIHFHIRTYLLVSNTTFERSCRGCSQYIWPNNQPAFAMLLNSWVRVDRRDKGFLVLRPCECFYDYGGASQKFLPEPSPKTPQYLASTFTYENAVHAPFLLYTHSRLLIQ